MLSRKPAPVNGILTGSLVSGTKSASSKAQFDSKSFDRGGVGLGIVAALDRRGEIPANKAMFSRSFNRSSSIPVKSPRIGGGLEKREERFDRNKFNAKMYGDDRNPFRIQNGGVSSKRPSVFHISPVRFVESDDFFPPSDFLSSCNLCRKKLHNEDIYIYRGENAFCSEECRYKEIVTDERREKSVTESSIRAVVEIESSTPLANAQALPTGILAT